MQITFQEAYNQYSNYIELRLKFQSIKKIKNRIENHILPYFKDLHLTDIKESDYLNWQLLIEKNTFSYSYKKSLHFAMVSFLNYCMKYYNLEKNVASRVGCFKNKENLQPHNDFYTLEEFNTFIKYCDNNIYKQFFNLMFYTGTRPGEAMALKFSDLRDGFISINKTISKELKNGSRVINTPKTRSSNRTIAIDNILNNDLLLLRKYYQEKYNNYSYDYYIFGGLKPLTFTTITRVKNQTCQKAKIKQIRLHDFRHSHATLLVQNDLMINEISRRLGHSNVSITLNTYVHTNFEQEKKVINTLNSLRLN